MRRVPPASRPVLFGLPLLFVGVASACGSSGAALRATNAEGGARAEGGAEEAGAAAGSDALAGPGIDAAPEAAVGPDTPAVEARVSALLAQMTLDEKIGQMIMVDYSALASLDDITTYFLGALLPSGDEAPAQNTPQAWLALTSSFRPKALATRLAIPLIVGIDAVHGTAKMAGATVFPHDIGLGCARDPALVTSVERATAEEVLAMGFTMVFSPDADVGQDERWGRTYESFGEDPALASQMVAAAVTGYQESAPDASGALAPLLACPKHCLGAGGTSWGTGVMGGIDQGDAQVTEAQMRAVHLPPFKAAVDAGAMAIMVSYSSLYGTKMSASAHWLTDVVKGELGFSGFLLSDFDAIRQLAGSSQEQAATAINAGLDMIMMSSGYAGFVDDVKALVAAGTIPMSRIDDAATRILRAKVVAGLFEAKAPGAAGLSTVGSAPHKRDRAPGGARVARPPQERRRALAPVEVCARRRGGSRRERRGGPVGRMDARLAGGHRGRRDAHRRNDDLRRDASGGRLAGARHVFMERERDPFGDAGRRGRPLREPVRRVRGRHQRPELQQHVDVAGILRATSSTTASPQGSSRT